MVSCSFATRCSVATSAAWFAASVNGPDDDTLLLPDTERLAIDAMQSSDKPTATAWRSIT